jgi:hypothetical protein
MQRWNAIYEERERYKNLRREAEIEQLVRQVNVRRAQHASWHCCALNWLGHQLVTWGYRLQERYSAATTTTALDAKSRFA